MDVLQHRRQWLAKYIDISQKVGVEMGPLDRPVIRRDDGPILYLDHLSTADLKQKYTENIRTGLIDEAALVEVDLIADGRPFSAILEDRPPVDYVLACHVIEHIPNPLGWLIDISKGLADDGRIALVIPDGRFTFDHFRTPSPPSPIIEAFLENRTMATAGQVFDHIANAAQVDPDRIWRGEPIERVPIGGHIPAEALRIAKTMVADGAPAPDIHCFVYTPWSFASLLRQVIALDILPFKVVSISTTEPGGIEFCVILEKSSEPVAARVSTVPVLDKAVAHNLPQPEADATSKSDAAVPVEAKKTGHEPPFIKRLAHLIPQEQRRKMLNLRPIAALYQRLSR